MAPVVERAVVPDGGERSLGYVGAVVKDPPADPNSHQTPEEGLVRGAVEGVEVVHGGHLPQALVHPEPRVVDGAVDGPERTESDQAALQQNEIQRADQEARRQEPDRGQMSRHVVKREGGKVQQGDDEDAEPPREEEDPHGADIVPVLGRKAAGELLPDPKMIESGVPVDGSWNLEAG